MINSPLLPPGLPTADKQIDDNISDVLALNNMSILPTSVWAESPSESTDRPLEVISRGKKTFYAIEPGSWDTPSNLTSPMTVSVPSVTKFRPERTGKDRSGRAMGGRMQIRAGEMHSPVSPGDSNKSPGNQPTYCVVTAKTTRAHISVLESRTSAAEVSTSHYLFCNMQKLVVLVRRRCF